MSSMRTLIDKLLKALEYERGVIYCLDKRQYYSETINRRCTKYTLHRTYKNKEGKTIKENHQFSKQIEVILFLTKELGIGCDAS